MKFTSLLVSALLLVACTKDKKPKEYDVMRTTMTETAKVTKVDYTKRRITLDTDDGPVTIVAGNEIRNLNSIKKGDTVVAEYQSALVYTIEKPGKQAMEDYDAKAWRAKKGEQPGAGTKTEIRTSAVITDIDYKEPAVTLQNKAGEKEEFHVQHPERLQGVKVGDVVNIKYSEAMAVRVQKKPVGSEFLPQQVPSGSTKSI